MYPQRNFSASAPIELEFVLKTVQSGLLVFSHECIHGLKLLFWCAGLYLLKQESLANAKVSGRQQWVYCMKAPHLRQINAMNIMLTSTFNGLQRYGWQYGLSSLAVVASQICQISRNSPKIRIYSSSRSSKVIYLGANRKRICNFLLIINSNFDRISYRVRNIDAFFSKIACFPNPSLFDAPSGGTSCDINVIYTPLKSTLNGL